MSESPVGIVQKRWLPKLCFSPILQGFLFRGRGTNYENKPKIKTKAKAVWHGSVKSQENQNHFQKYTKAGVIKEEWPIIPNLTSIIEALVTIKNSSRKSDFGWISGKPSYLLQQYSNGTNYFVRW